MSAASPSVQRRPSRFTFCFSSASLTSSERALKAGVGPLRKPHSGQGSHTSTGTSTDGSLAVTSSTAVTGPAADLRAAHRAFCASRIRCLPSGVS